MKKKKQKVIKKSILSKSSSISRGLSIQTTRTDYSIESAMTGPFEVDRELVSGNGGDTVHALDVAAMTGTGESQGYHSLQLLVPP